MLTAEKITKYCGDIKFLQRLEQTIAGLSKVVNPVKNLVRKDICNADLYMLEAIAILGKVSRLSKSERDTILNVIEFTIDYYEKWKSGTDTEETQPTVQ